MTITTEPSKSSQGDSSSVTAKTTAKSIPAAGSSFFSSFTSSFVSGKATTDITKRFNSLSQTLQQHARELPRSIAKLPDHFDTEREKFVKNKSPDEKSPSPHSELVMPWQGYGAYEQELKRRILEISKDQRNFTIPPPEDTTFEFDLKAYSQSSRAILSHDNVLSQMRFLLVPQQVDENSFWRNYWYRLINVKKAVLNDSSIQCTLTDNSHHEVGGKQENDAVLFDFTADSGDEEEENDRHLSVKETKPSQDAMGDVLDKSSVPEDDDMEEWERELRRAAAGGL